MKPAPTAEFIRTFERVLFTRRVMVWTFIPFARRARLVKGQHDLATTLRATRRAGR